MKRLILFTSPTCGPCRMVKPLVRKVENEGTEVQYIDITEDAENTNLFDITSVPTIIVTDENNKEIDRNVGMINMGKLKELLI